MPEIDTDGHPKAATGTSDLRAGETALSAGAPCADAQLVFIGRIHTPWKRREDCPRQGRQDGPLCRLELDDIWVPALGGIEQFKALELLYWLDRSRRDLLVQNPGRMGRLKGTFALRSPLRPNPIGSSIVRLVSVEAPNILVRGLDCISGTPLLDIKPDHCPYASGVSSA